ncbi:hypothetical protein ACHAWF_007627 [Thalassiosira exigua]
MVYLKEEDNTKHQSQFTAYISLEELYEYKDVHKTHEDPSPIRKKVFTPDKSFKRKTKQTLEQRKADDQAKKDVKIAELKEDDE